ncbi:hypothetical protein ACSBLW_12185 [Thioclava sp. FR2]|uniref:hypothetical protein n=1 Tax=Thioclava sp. FR2 TaxID=3445780 RepID=UPI003EBA4220
MHSLADTKALTADGVITPEQAKIIEARARDIMVSLAINTVLCVGILAATGGMILWLGNAVAVAISGVLLLVIGLFILSAAGEMVRMFGNASALIGAGMLIGGAALELVEKYEEQAGMIMLIGGALVAAIAARAMIWGGLTTRFVQGSILLMGVTLHLVGVATLAEDYQIAGLGQSAIFLYCAIVIALAGYLVDIRFVTACAIAPFAQMLDTGTGYFHAAYFFYSPEPTLTILQMGALVALMLWWALRLDERKARHARTLAIFAFIVANLAALVGSLWGDMVGETLWGPGWDADSGLSFEEWDAALAAFREKTLVISANAYAVIWALALIAIGAWSAHTGRRVLFNAALTFGGIHAYTQLFESFGDQPLAYVIGGFAAIPLAWGAWRLNHWFAQRPSP